MPIENKDTGTNSAQDGAVTESTEELLARIATLEEDKEKLQGVIENLRPYEKKAKHLSNAVKVDSPDKLLEYQERIAQLEEAEKKQEERDLQIRNAVAAEYQQKLSDFEQQANKSLNTLKEERLKNAAFVSFVQSEGIADSWDAVYPILRPYLEMLDGKVIVKAEGKLLNLKDETDQLVQATPEMFFNAIAKDKYQVPGGVLAKYAFKQPKASSVDMPDSGGLNGSRDWRELKGADLKQAAWG